jgi:hypothetical protein
VGADICRGHPLTLTPRGRSIMMGERQTPKTKYRFEVLRSEASGLAFTPECGFPQRSDLRGDAARLLLAPHAASEAGPRRKPIWDTAPQRIQAPMANCLTVIRPHD